MKKHDGSPLKLAFMTLGCPGWDLDGICANGRKLGFQGVDFRGYLDTLDVTLLPLFTTHAQETRKRLADAGLAACCISSSIRVCDPEARQANREEAARTITTASGLGAGVVRIFGGGDLAGHSRADLVSIGRDMIGEILSLDGARGLTWVFETHDLWIKGRDCAELLSGIPDPHFGALWDMGLTSRVGGESPEETFSAIGSRVGHCHVKDAVHEPGHAQAMEDGWRYVPAGTGTLPLAASIRLLRRSGYDGWFVFEHEKRWHPDLPEPEEAFPVFMRWAKTLS